MIEKGKRAQLVIDHTAATAELHARLTGGSTEQVAASQAKISALEAQIAAQDATLNRLRSGLEAERQTRKLRALKKLADECTKLEDEETRAAEKAEAALAEYVTVAVRTTDAQNALRERFVIEAGDNRLADRADAISGKVVRQTPFAHLLSAAVAPIWQARFEEKQAADRRAFEERRRETERESERRAGEARRADAAEEQRLADRGVEQEKEDRAARRALAESWGVPFRE